MSSDVTAKTWVTFHLQAHFVVYASLPGCQICVNAANTKTYFTYCRSAVFSQHPTLVSNYCRIIFNQKCVENDSLCYTKPAKQDVFLRSLCCHYHTVLSLTHNLSGIMLSLNPVSSPSSDCSWKSTWIISLLCMGFWGMKWWNSQITPGWSHVWGFRYKAGKYSVIEGGECEHLDGWTHCFSKRGKKNTSLFYSSLCSTFMEFTLK